MDVHYLVNFYASRYPSYLQGVFVVVVVLVLVLVFFLWCLHELPYEKIE